MRNMSEAGERLAERGEKLDRLQDKTARLALQADEFANLAKKLNEQQRSWW